MAVNNPCQRFDEEAIEKLDNGEPLDAHFSQCPDCITAAERHQQLIEALGNLHEIEASEASEISSDWQSRVLDEIAALDQATKEPANAANTETTEPPTKKFPSRFGLAAGLAVLALSLPIAYNQLKVPTPNIPLTYSVVQGEQVYRSRDPAIGDTLIILGPKDAQLRLYRNDQLLYKCGNPEPCTSIENALKVTWQFETRGDYQILLVTHPQNSQFTANRLDQDVLLATDMGWEIELAGPVVVR